MPGKLVILSGPSGAGKSTIVRHLLSNPDYNLAFSVSACSRKKREGEIEGKDYYFITVDSFKSKIEEHEFLEWEEVYPSLYTELSKQKSRSSGRWGKCNFDVDVMGGINIKRKYKEEAVSIFIKPPSLEVLEERLTKRNTDTPDSIAKRVRKARMEMVYANKFDHQIINEVIETACKEADQVVRNFLNS
jgi:guanylate kinase